MLSYRHISWLSFAGAVVLFFLSIRWGLQPELLQRGQSVGPNAGEQFGRCRKRTFEPNKWSMPIVPNQVQTISQEDDILADYICQEWLIPPSKKPRNLTVEQTYYSQGNQSAFIDNLLKQKRNGFYIECGAANGQDLSNTLFFEKEREWSGLLVEANRDYFKDLVYKNRKAYTINACLSPETQPTVLKFQSSGIIGGIADLMSDEHKERVEKTWPGPVLEIQCFPLVSILNSLQVHHVDFLSLDVEGAEMAILKTIPFDRIQIDVICLEYLVPASGVVTQLNLDHIQEFLVEQRGYEVATMTASDEDIILVRSELLKSLKS